MDPSTLTPTECLLWDAFPAGTVIDVGDLPPEQRRVRAEVIAALLRGERATEPGAAATIHLQHAVVTGQLKLAFAEVPHPLLLTECELEQRPDLYWARANFLRFHNCRLPGLDGSNLQVERHLQFTGSTFDGDIKLGGAKISGGLLFDRTTLKGLTADRVETGGDVILDGAKASGAISLYMATIGGNLDLDDATFANPDGVAFGAGSTTVAGGCYARRCTFSGEVSLRHSRFSGAVSFSGSSLDNGNRPALRIDRADIAGGLWMLEPCTVKGSVSMVDTRVGRSLVLTGAALHNPGGVALDASGVGVEGAVDANRLRAEGTIKLFDANVNGPIRFQGATLSNPGGVALVADGLRTSSIVDCCEGFTAEGHLTFGGAKIGGALCFNRAVVGTLKCWRTEAPELALGWAEPPKGLVDLRFARVGVLRDDPAVWPEKLRLDGLTYEALEPIIAVRERLRLLARDPDGYRPQPYEQLAAVSRRLGHDDEARSVLMAKQRRRTASAGGLTRWWGRLQDATVGYGYRPLRAAAWLLLALTVGSVAFAAHPPDRLDPNKDFVPVMYTLDVLLPLVEFGQEGAFEPQGNYRWLMYALMATGWILATTVAAGIARSVRRD
ncbi:MAG TPA: pentapeptide repeat-containing protein [Candidatus Limnocylindrales bacterium]